MTEPDWEVLKASKRYAELYLGRYQTFQCFTLGAALHNVWLNRSCRHMIPICREWLGLPINDMDADRCPFEKPFGRQYLKLLLRIMSLNLISSKSFRRDMRGEREARYITLSTISERSGIDLGRLACIEYGQRPTRREREKIAWAIFGEWENGND